MLIFNESTAEGLCFNKSELFYIIGYLELLLPFVKLFFIIGFYVFYKIWDILTDFLPVVAYFYSN